jgi:CheY-like chemotaxis protein
MRLLGGRLDLRKAQILVVDDSPRAMDVLCAILRGFRVRNLVQCESVKVAADFVKTHPVDLILADCEMQTDDAIEFARQLRAETEGPNFTVPIVLLSAYASRPRAMAARDAGVNMVIAKPVIPAVLLSRIEWVARTNREFVVCDSYRGPDRRLKPGVAPEGTPERRAQLLAIAAQHDKALSQSDVDSLFG